MEYSQLAFVAGLVVSLVVAAASDLSTRLIPNACPVAIAVFGMALAVARAEVPEALLGAVSVAAVLLGTNAVFARARGERGMGGGDIKLMCALGVWTGAEHGLALVAVACALGLMGRFVTFITHAVSGHKVVISQKKTTVGGIPMAPAIGLAAIVVLLLKTI